MSRENPFGLPADLRADSSGHHYAGDSVHRYADDNGHRYANERHLDDDDDYANEYDDHGAVVVSSMTLSTASKMSSGSAANAHHRFADNLMAAVASSTNGQRRFDSGGSDDERPDILSPGVSGGAGRDFSSNSPSPGRGSPSLSPERELDSPCPDDSSDENPAHQVSGGKGGRV
jgi:hypothetical protein